MYKILIISVLVALATARLSKPELDEEWMTFKKLYNKMYLAKEEVMRRLIWEQNLDFIQKHNLAFDRKEVSHTVGMNEYGDMTNEEFVKTMNGYKMSENRQPGSLYMPPSNIGDLPDKVDWRPLGYVTSIKNQGQCGSCWSFSATGSLEGQHFKANKSLVSLSEQNLVDCSTKQGNQGCEGGLMDQAFKYIKENNGIDTEASYPYKAKNGKCNFKPADVGATDTGFVDIKSKSESDLQSAVATVGPISVAIDASHMSFQLYRSGVYHSFFCSETRLDHGVLAVGYGSEGSEDYWIVKNSWGESWGQKGYIWMSRNRHNNCGIATQASYPTV